MVGNFQAITVLLGFVKTPGQPQRTCVPSQWLCIFVTFDSEHAHRVAEPVQLDEAQVELCLQKNIPLLLRLRMLFQPDRCRCSADIPNLLDLRRLEARPSLVCAAVLCWQSVILTLP